MIWHRRSFPNLELEEEVGFFPIGVDPNKDGTAQAWYEGLVRITIPPRKPGPLGGGREGQIVRAGEDKEMSSFQRPLIEVPVFRDGEGQVIKYGNRWAAGPPEDTYSVETHPERFAPLHTVADALINHLRDTYDVEVEESEEVEADLLRPPFHNVVRAVRIRPNGPSCAALTFVLTAYPGIYMQAGLLNGFRYPVCGCDACDSTWEAEADDLERQVHAVVTGHYRESIERRLRGPWVGYDFTYPDGGEGSGGTLANDIPAERIKAAKRILRKLSDGWSEWPRAASSS